MTRTLRDDMRADMRNTFLAEGEFAERVVYCPREGRPRSIMAHVNRNPPAPVDGSTGIAPRAIVTVANDSVYGISSTEVDNGGDKIDIALKQGDTASSRHLGTVILQTHAFLKIEVR